MDNQKKTVNLVPGLSGNVVYTASQYDIGRVLEFVVVDGVTPYTIPGTATVTLSGTKPSGLGFSEECTITADGTATVETTLAMTQESGKIGAEIRIVDGDEDIGTANFLWYVEPTPHDTSVTDGTTATAQSLLERAEEVITEAEELVAQASTAGVPATVRQAIYTLLNAAAYLTTGLDDEIAIVEGWASSTATAISLSAETLSFSTLQATQQLTATLTPSDSTDTIAWSSSDESIATVDQTGLVTSVAYGNAVITATTGLVSATCTVYIIEAALVSISAVYTQSGTVYDSAALNTLKADLVVTGTYDDSSTATISSDAYTLSGTLTEGTSTITVTYSGLTTTFDVTVTADPNQLMYNWDFTSSMIDTVSSLELTLGGSATRDSSGITFGAADAYISGLPSFAGYTTLSDAGRVFRMEIDVASASRVGSNHSRFIMWESDKGLIYRKTGYWQTYFNLWSNDTTYSDANMFSGQTVIIKHVIGSSHELNTYLVYNETETLLKSASYGTGPTMIGSSGGQSFYNMVITGMRVYEEVGE